MTSQPTPPSLDVSPLDKPFTKHDFTNDELLATGLIANTDGIVRGREYERSIDSWSYQALSYKLAKFALANNGFEYRYHNNNLIYKIPPSYFLDGINAGRMYSFVIWPDKSIRLALYDITPSDGLRSYPTYGITPQAETNSLLVAIVKLNYVGPKIIVTGDDSFIARQSMQTIQTEGAFSKFYRLEIPRYSHIDALQIITPDVMEDMLNFSSDNNAFTNYRANFEINDDHLYIITSPLAISSSAKFNKSVGDIVRLRDEINDQLSVYRKTSHHQPMRLTTVAKYRRRHGRSILRSVPALSILINIVVLLFVFLILWLD